MPGHGGQRQAGAPGEGHAAIGPWGDREESAAGRSWWREGGGQIGPVLDLFLEHAGDLRINILRSW